MDEEIIKLSYTSTIVNLVLRKAKAEGLKERETLILMVQELDKANMILRKVISQDILKTPKPTFIKL